MNAKTKNENECDFGLEELNSFNYNPLSRAKFSEGYEMNIVVVVIKKSGATLLQN